MSHLAAFSQASDSTPPSRHAHSPHLSTDTRPPSYRSNPSCRSTKHHSKAASLVSHDPAFDRRDAFDCPTRPPLKVNPFKLIFNFGLSFGIVGALIAGYAMSLSILDLGVTSIGLYGIVVLSEYLFQVFSALYNRFDVERMARELRKKTTHVQTAADCETGEKSPDGNVVMNPGGEVSVGVVGYREDEESWKQCLRTLKMQLLQPKCIVGVVDGNEQPDLDMAEAFVHVFDNCPHFHLPILLSDLHFDTYHANVPTDTRSRLTKFRDWLTGRFRPGHAIALSIARQVVIAQVLEWEKQWNLSKYPAVVFSQPHGHKRTALFTAFAVNLYAMRTRDAVFTTDSDTIIQPNALDEMLALLRSGNQLGGVTAAVKIWNRSDNLLTRLCSTRYWFAFNIERACQSIWGCVSCLSGPIALYRSSDLDTILGPWNLQMFGGKHTTFGDDRHLTNQILAHGLQTRYTHRTWCDSESPTKFVRWIAQQTRWTKSFFREAFWFPIQFAYHHPWMLLEMTIHTLYPFFLMATAFHLLFDPSDGHKYRPLVWLITIFGLAFVKSLVALFIEFDLWLLLFAFYGFIHFFGLLPTKLWALMTLNSIGWGTSARSSSEIKKGQSFLQRSFLIGHLVVWFAIVFTGIGFFIYKMFNNTLLLLISLTAVLIACCLYWDSQKIEGYKERLQAWYQRKRGKPAPNDSVVVVVDEKTLPEKPEPALQPPSLKGKFDTPDVISINPTPAASIRDAQIGVIIPPSTAKIQHS